MRHDQLPGTDTTYQGRPLPRPDEDLVDQGLGFDLRTLLDRRQVLRALGLGAATVGLAACTRNTVTEPTTSPSAAAATTEIPDETAGPYPGDGSNGPDVLEQSGVVRSDIRSSFDGASATAEGVPLTLELTITDLADGGTPFAGVAVYVWHCDREGRYSMYSEGITDQNYLRGVQVADEAGKVSFTTIFPGCYTGRWPHIHFEVYPSEADITDVGAVIATSQIALPQDVCDAVYAEPGYEDSIDNLAQLSLDTDNVFGDDRAELQLATVTGDTASGYTATLPVGIDTNTTPTGGQLDGDGQPSGAPVPPSGRPS
ncbi:MULTISPECIES: intradiol ring-cleavage dioxygenase [unclassified Solwaraspora]|uniref:intradiol ring-cleavage dioxygenase n=1 Tax=unclassified Solwaraspora TaxID=2627926 RepID=UPI00259B6599|nr:intradiol ring-cleavage dioxygenase [Solwaraspora sp. WMMA2056]WJK43706.1 intradiol ring-cleavage dioxygenase [Solwaraspora sp. WMMA2056]